ncbi:hypothetical protein [Streptomyces phaeochromogenes]|uniref:hypothetical protein n=1 Tax=Streptomyces phaeochromogenes TaxID=1923 RepID=UPI00386BC027|nr:hypothetical protein OHB08_01335 [Streptomyces phaeochromogenes]
MNLNPLLQALDLQEDAARALADDLRTQIDTLQTQLREAELRLEHLAITRTTISEAGAAVRAVAQARGVRPAASSVRTSSSPQV